MNPADILSGINFAMVFFRHNNLKDREMYVSRSSITSGWIII